MAVTISIIFFGRDSSPNYEKIWLVAPHLTHKSRGSRADKSFTISTEFKWKYRIAPLISHPAIFQTAMLSLHAESWSLGSDSHSSSDKRATKREVVMTVTGVTVFCHGHA